MLHSLHILNSFSSTVCIWFWTIYLIIILISSAMCVRMTKTDVFPIKHFSSGNLFLLCSTPRRLFKEFPVKVLFNSWKVYCLDLLTFKPWPVIRSVKHPVHHHILILFCEKIELCNLPPSLISSFVLNNIEPLLFCFFSKRNYHSSRSVTICCSHYY